MGYNETTLKAVLDAAVRAACPIIHISALAGQAPFIASSPCLGDSPVPLIGITLEGYLALMAEIRNALIVEHDAALPYPVRAGGARDPHAADTRVALSPRTVSGYLDLPAAKTAMHYLLDSVGQETTIVYLGLRSFAEIQTYWRRRNELCRTFAQRYEWIDDDVHDLSYWLDHTTDLVRFDLEAFARSRGLSERTHAAVG